MNDVKLIISPMLLDAVSTPLIILTCAVIAMLAITVILVRRELKAKNKKDGAQGDTQ